MNLVEYGLNYGTAYRRRMVQQQIKINLDSSLVFSRFERYERLNRRPTLRLDGIRIGAAIQSGDWEELRATLNGANALATQGFYQSEKYDELVAEGHLFRCSCCDKFHPVENVFQEAEGEEDGHLCTNCNESGRLFYSAYEECYFPRDMLVAVYEYSGSRDIHTYCSRDYAENTFRYSEYTDRWHNGEYDDEDNDEESESDEEKEYSDYPIRNRHMSRNAVYHLEGHPEYSYLPTLGLELEYEVNTDRYDEGRTEIAAAVLECLGTDYCSVEEDGSLDNGFEIVTSWGTLDMHEQRLRKWMTFRYQDALHNANDTCGVHVHVARGNMSPLHATKLVWFINAPAQDDLNFAVARRGGCAYAKDMDKETVHKRAYLNAKVTNGLHRGAYINNLNADRYEKVSFETQGNKTVEFRLFAGTRRYDQIMAALEYAQAVMLFTREVGMRQLTTNDFLSFIEEPERRPLTRYLRQMLQLADFDVIFMPQELTYTLAGAATQRERQAA